MPVPPPRPKKQPSGTTLTPFGPRTPVGAQTWVLFFTLLTTCGKQGLNFFAYLLDRISGSYPMPALADLVRAHAPTGS